MKQSSHDVAILIDANIWAKLRHWIKLAGQDEVSCLGLIDEVKDEGRITALMVSEIYLLEQTISGADVELVDKAVANLMIKLATEGIDTSRLRCWIHSHAGMKTFWSTTDEECCSMLTNDSYSLSIVTNLRGDLLTRLDFYKPFRLTLDGIATRVHYTCSKDLEELYTAEFEAKVTRWSDIVRPSKQLVPTVDFQTEEDLEKAFENGYINMNEYEQMSGQSLFDDF